MQCVVARVISSLTDQELFHIRKYVGKDILNKYFDHDVWTKAVDGEPYNIYLQSDLAFVLSIL